MFVKPRRLFLIILLLALIVVSAQAVWAQDFTTNTPAGEAVVTVEPLPTTPPDVPPVETPSTTSLLIDKIFDIVMLIAVVVLAFKQAALIPPQVLDSVMEKLFGYAKGVTTQIPGDADDRLLSITEEVFRRWIREEQAKLQPPTKPSIN